MPKTVHGDDSKSRFTHPVNQELDELVQLHNHPLLLADWPEPAERGTH